MDGPVTFNTSISLESDADVVRVRMRRIEGDKVLRLGIVINRILRARRLMVFS